MCHLVRVEFQNKKYLYKVHALQNLLSVCENYVKIGFAVSKIRHIDRHSNFIY